jgi:ribose 5-phosphate isomerase A
VKAKKAVAEKACGYVKDGMVVGLGTGSTAELAIKRLGELDLDIQGIPSSVRTEGLARSVGIDIVPWKEFLEKKPRIDLDIDGADRVDPDWNLIKGGGGAHTREKIVANASRLFYCIVDDSKLVKKLAGSFPIAVEVRPDSVDSVKRELAGYGASKLRMRDQKVFITDNSNYILDFSLSVGEPVERLEVDINEIPGVVDNGLFTRRKPDRVFVGYPDGRVDTL